MFLLFMSIGGFSDADIDVIDVQWIQRDKLRTALREWDKTVVAETDLQTGNTVIISEGKYTPGTSFCPGSSNKAPLLLCPLYPAFATDQGLEPLKVEGFRFHFGDLLSLRQFANGESINIWTGHEWGGVFRSYLLLFEENKLKNVALRLSKHSEVHVGEVSRLFGESQKYFLFVQRNPLQNTVTLCLYSMKDSAVIHQLPFNNHFIGFDVCGPEEQVRLFYQKDDGFYVGQVILQNTAIAMGEEKKLPSGLSCEFRSFALKDDSLYVQEPDKLHFYDLGSMEEQSIELKATRINASPFGLSAVVWSATDNALFIFESSEKQEIIQKYCYRRIDGRLIFEKAEQ
jgi:hypothetical protein